MSNFDFHSTLKPLFDFLVSLIGLLLLWPLLLTVSVLIRIKLGSPIFFRQQRPGLHETPFFVYKFRTMRNSVDADGVMLADDQRMAKLGTFLRTTSLDELPELWNVLKGEMSLVGPRPLLMEYLPLYTAEQARRHEVKPGITGWAQVNGRNSISWEEKFELDVWYVDHQSVWLDLKILYLTFAKVVAAEGITQLGKVTADAFRGNSTR